MDRGGKEGNTNISGEPWSDPPMTPTLVGLSDPSVAWGSQKSPILQMMEGKE